jgi:hypothetical protein
MEIKVGEQALFLNNKQQWVTGEFVANVEESFIYRIDDDIFIAKEMKKIEVKDTRNTYHFVYYTDKSELYSNGVDIKAGNMADALIMFSEKYAKIEPIYIIKK